MTSNVYQITLPVKNCTNAANDFKYVTQPGTGWESPSSADANGQGNRWFINTVSQTLPVVYFNDQPLNESASALIDFVTVTNCEVTFTVQMTNAVGTNVTGGVTNIIPFDNMYPSANTVWINGVNAGQNGSWWGWATYPISGGASGYQMTQIPNTTLFTITLPINQGQNEYLEYKYSMEGYDNEAGFNDNHYRWIRSLPDYTMPVDTFGSQGTSSSYEISFGNLAITNLGNQQVQVSWLGRNGVELQTTPGLSPAAWVSQPLTDGTNLTVGPGGEASTNYTIGSGSLFYRLTGPQ